MKKVLKKLEWWFDIYIAYFLYSDRKKHLYYDYINKKYNFMQNTDDLYEECIMCHGKTETLKTTHIDFRYGYVEGAGQLCRECYISTNRNLITIDERTILDTPNDLELGKKVRERYWDTKK